MPRKLKTYQTSIGFFDLAIAAPSMKAAAEAWGSDTDVFKKGFAKETDDPEIVAATMAKPGVLLRRAVGSNDLFNRNPELPQIDKVTKRGASSKHKKHKAQPHSIDNKVAKEAALAFEREQKRRESAQRKEQASREKKRKERAREIAKGERALENAKRQHQNKITATERERTVLERRLEAEEKRWEKQKDKLEAALRRLRG
jgi:hypothetical protein